jgi:HK97 family phage major capsid protein
MEKQELAELLRDTVMTKSSLEADIVEKMDSFKADMAKAGEEAKSAGVVANETKSQIEAHSEKLDAMLERLANIEQKGLPTVESKEGRVDIGKSFLDSDQFKMMAEGRSGRARLDIKTAIINATGQNQPLVPADRLGGVSTEPNRMLSIRDIIPSSATSSNLIEFVKENVFTNNAGPQVAGSPEAFENVTKPESGITFTLSTAAVTTLAHFIPASKQVLDDSPSLASFINGRLMYGLKLVEETQLVTGSGANGNLNGFHTQATAYSVQSPQLTNELDIVREMIKQAHVAEYGMPDYIVMNPQDWYDIDVRKVGTSDDRYVVGNPREMSNPRLWGVPVVVSNSMTSGQVVVGSFGMGCEIKDRQAASVEVSLEDSTNFQKNMVTIRAEERIAFCVYRPSAFIKATI